MAKAIQKQHFGLRINEGFTANVIADVPAPLEGRRLPSGVVHRGVAPEPGPAKEMPALAEDERLEVGGNTARLNQLAASNPDAMPDLGALGAPGLTWGDVVEEQTGPQHSGPSNLNRLTSLGGDNPEDDEDDDEEEEDLLHKTAAEVSEEQAREDAEKRASAQGNRRTKAQRKADNAKALLEEAKAVNDAAEAREAERLKLEADEAIKAAEERAAEKAKSGGDNTQDPNVGAGEKTPAVPTDDELDPDKN